MLGKFFVIQMAKQGQRSGDRSRFTVASGAEKEGITCNWHVSSSLFMQKCMNLRHFVLH